MNKAEAVNAKQYSTTAKVVAVILLILAPIVLIISVSEAVMKKDMVKYGLYYRWEITGAEAEKQPDGKYLITAHIKNTSAYRATLSDYSVNVRYGNNAIAENELSSGNYPIGEFYDIFKHPIVPAGQTISYNLLVSLPEGTNTVRLQYDGTSYDMDDIFGEQEDKVYTLKLQ